MHAGPNPVHDHLVIQCRLESHCHARLILRALDGSVVFERKLGEREGGDWREEIPCGHLSDGIYWLELRGEHESHEKEEARFKVAVRHGHAER